jgi:hypothetical protein
MVVCFQFVITASLSSGTEELATLSDIDNELCEKLGKTPDPDEWSVEYNLLTTLGLCVCSRAGDNKCFATLDAYNGLLADNSSFGFTPKEAEVYRDFICGKYTFRAFR